MSPPQRRARGRARGRRGGRASCSRTRSASAGGDIDIGGAVFQLNLAAAAPAATTRRSSGRSRWPRDADVAVVVVGTTEEVESEGFDRTSLALPGRQDELVRRVAAANPRTVVVVNAGAPVLLPWADEVAAVLLAWFPGPGVRQRARRRAAGRRRARRPAADDLAGVRGPAAVDRSPSTACSATTRGCSSATATASATPATRSVTAWATPPGSTAAIEAPRPARRGRGLEVAVTVANTGDRRGPRGRPGLRRRSRRAASSGRRAGSSASRRSTPSRARSSRCGSPSGPARSSTGTGGWTVEPGRFRLGAGPSSAALPVDTYVEVRD